MILKCACGGEKFIRVARLKKHSTGSVVDEVAGFHCASCLRAVDTARLVQLAELKDKKTEYERLKKEIEGANETPERKAEPGKPGTRVDDKAPRADRVPDEPQPA